MSPNKKLALFIGLATIIGGTAALLTYLESRKTRKLQEQVLALDKQLKELHLLKERSGLSV